MLSISSRLPQMLILFNNFFGSLNNYCCVCKKLLLLWKLKNTALFWDFHMIAIWKEQCHTYSLDLFCSVCFVFLNNILGCWVVSLFLRTVRRVILKECAWLEGSSLRAKGLHKEGRWVVELPSLQEEQLQGACWGESVLKECREQK